MTRTDSPSNASRTAFWARCFSIFCGVAAIAALALYTRFGWGPDSAQAQQTAPPVPRAKVTAAPRTPAATTPAPAKTPVAVPAKDVMATVNGEQIKQADLAAECLRHYGSDVLETMVNKFLITSECKKRNVVVTEQEVKTEIDRMAERFGVPTDKWLELLETERHISPDQYAKDIIWPTIALRKLATSQLNVTPQEVRDAYETQYGPAVQCRLIACDSLENAQKIREQALAKPDDFPNLAKQHSVDPNSASAKGLIQPIRKHLGDKKIEAAAFSLQPGAISDILQVADQYVFLKCEKHLPARDVKLEGKIQQVLVEAIRDKKLRLVADDVFAKLQEQSQVELIFNDPDKRAAQPEVAAIVNGQQLLTRDMAAECVKRHGPEMLDAMISRRLLDQACRQKKIAITPADVDQEIAHAATLMGKLDAQGRPDISAWLVEVTENNSVPVEVYKNDSVVPSVMLKKLVGQGVEVTEADLQKGFDANYGPRVRCLAIVMDNQRRAQEVWDKARKNLNEKFFGDLAEQYSTDASTRVLRGEIPPIQKHGGEPLLEKEAFALNDADPMSGIIQVGDQFVILYYQGLTQPSVPDFATVRNDIYADLYEKKLRLAMATEFDRLQENARIVNELTGETHLPKQTAKSSAKNPAAIQQTEYAPAAKKPAPPRR
ncbi:MAG: peptidylprolyl isomerase [Planctomycetia bacterium]|nr:peptidylprolyl isomerase [Planctomycetia bacterium]